MTEAPLRPESFSCKTGLCWNQAMEKDARIQINPNTYIKFQLPELHNLYAQYSETHPLVLAIKDPEEKAEILYQAEQLLDPLVKDGFHPPFKSDNAKIRSYLKNKHRQEFLQQLEIKSLPCTCCEKGERPNIKQILPVGVNDKEVICYNSCLRTLFAATKRQLKRVFPPDPLEVERFQIYCKEIFDQEIKPLLRDFDYSYSQWYNHLEASKQKLMDQVEADIRSYKRYLPNVQIYNMFCKRELQFVGGKNRAIAGIDDMVQYVIGPVCWALEGIATGIKGYCGAASLGDLESTLEQMDQEGYTTVLQGDGSGFDLSQHDELKYIDKLVYDYISDKVWHVDPDIFRDLTLKSHKSLTAKYFDHNKAKALMTAIVRGTVFSGSSDTTLMNTLRQSMYIRYTLERKGLKYGEDFKHKAKGDDFMVFVNKPALPYKAWFDEVWAPKEKDPLTTTYQPHGLGLILKFLTIGDFDSIDFCSTVAIPCGPGKWKLARMPHRMNPLSHYSKNPKMTPLELKAYYEDLAIVMERHAADTLFYRNYSLAYRHYARMIQAKGELKECSGNRRNTRIPDGHRERENAFTPDMTFGKEYAYKRETLVSDNHANDDQVAAFLLNRYGMTRTDVENHAHFLLHGGLYNPISDYVLADQ